MPDSDSLTPPAPADPRQPRYQRALAALRGDVLGGVFPHRLPTEMDLAKRYEVSRMTLRRAIGVLVEEGLLEGRRGAGTFLRLNAAPSSTVVLLMAPDLAANIDDPYHQQLTLALVHACTRRGWTLRVAPSIEDLTVRLTAGRNLPISGCIAVAFAADSAAALASIPLRVVVVDGEPLAQGTAILPDSSSGIRAVVNRLVALGHREIVHCAGSLEKPAGRERLQAYLGAMGDAGVPLRGGSVAQGRFLIEDGYAAMARWWDGAVRPTAVVCANDMMAIGAMHWLTERGIAIGRQVSLVGCDGLSMSRLTWPGLSTLAIDFMAHLDAGLQAVLEAGPAGVRRTPMTLVERTSMGPAPR
jgi:DNA-binding LacI/PurR family transcriptional regulator